VHADGVDGATKDQIELGIGVPLDGITSLTADFNHRVGRVREMPPAVAVAGSVLQYDARRFG